MKVRGKSMAGFLEGVAEKATKAIKKATAGGFTADQTWEQLYASETGEPLWEINGKDWAKVFAYQFQVKVFGNGAEGSDTEFYYCLPIPPQSYQVKPVIPTKVTPTLGGVVEENSAITFWVISMAGTTGVGISRAEGDELTRQKVAGKFRESISTTGLLAGTFANLDRAVNKVVGVLNSVDGVISSVTDFATNPGIDGMSAISGEVTGAINNALLPPLPYTSSAVDAVTNGFTEAEEFQKFFYIYQRLKSENPKGYELYFINYKTQQKWRVVIKDFSLQKSAQNPLLYRYNITLQGWDISSSGTDNRVEFDRFGKDGDLKPVNTMNLGAGAGKALLSKIGKIFG